MKHVRQRARRIQVGIDEKDSSVKTTSHSTAIIYASRQGSGANDSLTQL